jgi:hypothetical protein
MTGSIKHPEVLIPPLGSKPQLVMLVIDLLLEREATLEEVIVIHRRPADRAVTGGRVRWHGVARQGRRRSVEGSPCNSTVPPTRWRVARTVADWGNP